MNLGDSGGIESLDDEEAGEVVVEFFAKKRRVEL